ncbi:structure-specific recognition protein 1 [Trypanosoma grayi]|uniref:structure-specific recognition protein 1 n=1 Tax=Trypanosoma grayi TaxID=71804 RepID=UPI0004F3F6A8|nr:structure-specific recognition protein 1 [Trypanosoma grayi]KEG14969.1 structure-specific recognition protein 1 [Trypanosoma grayi]
MSSLTGVSAATAAPPIENWGALKWSIQQQQHNGESGTANANVKHEGHTDEKNGSGDGNGEALLQLVSLPKPQHHSSGAPASVVEKPIVQIPVSVIASASAMTKNDLSLALRPQSSVSAMQSGSGNVSVELTSIRFAIPNVCVGHEQTEEAGREILAEAQQQLKKYQSRLLGDGAGTGAVADDQLLVMMAGGHRKDERVMAVLDDLTFSYPSGRYKLIVSNYAMVLEDKKRATGSGSSVVASVPLTDVVQLYLCDIPDSSITDEQEGDLAQYVVVILRNPFKVRTTTYNHLVISCPAGFALDEAHPWRCQLETQEEIDRALAALPHNQGSAAAVKTEDGGTAIKNTFAPTMSGRVSEILIRVLKAVTGVTALGGYNKEYQTSRGHSVLRCLHHGADGMLFVLHSALLFLHRPVTRVLLSDIKRVEIDESESGSATFQMVVFGSFGKRNTSAAAENKIVFSAIDRKEKAALLAYLEKRVTVRRIGLSIEDDDDDDDDDEEDADDEEDSGDEDDDDDDLDDDDEEDDESDDNRRRRKRQRSKEGKHEKGDKKRSKKEKKEKHHHHHRHHHKKHKDDKKEAAAEKAKEE